MNQPFAQARAEAEKSHRLVMLDFYTTWCGPCKLLDKVTWRDPAVVAWLDKNVLCLKIDAEKDVELAKRFGVNVYPTIVFVNGSDKETYRFSGFKEPKEFLALTPDVLAGVDSVASLQAKIAEATPDEAIMLRQDLGELYFARGQFGRALEEWLTCFDKGREIAAYTGVRATGLIGHLVQLSNTYAPARDALSQRREAAHAGMLRGSDTDARDYAAINSGLHENELTLKAFNEGTPSMRRALWRNVLSELVEAKRYRDIVDVAEDMQRDVEVAFVVEETMESMFGPKGKAPDSENYASARHRLKIDLARIFEIQLGAGRENRAQDVASRLLKFEGDGESFALLITAAIRAGQPATARELATLGLAHLPENQKALVQRAIEPLK